MNYIINLQLLSAREFYYYQCELEINLFSIKVHFIEYKFNQNENNLKMTS